MKSWQDGKDNLVDWVRTHPAIIRWGILTAVVVAFIFGVAQRPFAKPSQVSLFDSRPLSSDEMGKMQFAFGQEGLNEYEIKQDQIFVPREQRSDYLKALTEHRAVPDHLLPPPESTNPFGIFGNRAQQRIQQIEEKKRTIREMVVQLRFVERAMVDYDETSGLTPFDDRQRTAIVNVCPSENRPLGLSEVKAIRDTVCGAVAGLLPQEITIIDAPGGKSYTGEIPLDSEQGQPHTVKQNRAEQKYENKIRSALSAYPGIRVNVEVGVDPVVRKTRDEQIVQGEPRILQKITHRELPTKVPSTRPSPSIQNLFDFRLGANRQARVPESPEGDNSPAIEITESIANGSFETTIFSGPTITHVNVSIGIPERCVNYLVDQAEVPGGVNREALHAKIFEQLKEDIQLKVKPLVPGSELANPSQIVVTLDREIPLPESTIAGNVLTQAWPPLWPWLISIGGGVIVLVLLRIWIRSHRKHAQRKNAGHLPKTEGSQNAPTQSSSPGFDPSASQAIEREFGPAAPHFSVPTPDDLPNQPDSVSALAVEKQLMRDQLDQWCRDNPNAAADTIHQWLNRKAG